MSPLNHVLSIDAELADKLEHDERFRRSFIRMWAQTEVAAEIRGLRKKRRKRQSEVAAMTGTGQSAISRIEKAEYDGWTFKTLLSIAEKLDARLRITFEPIEDVIRSHRVDDGADLDPALVDGGETARGALWRSSEDDYPFDFKEVDDSAHHFHQVQ